MSDKKTPKKTESSHKSKCWPPLVCTHHHWSVGNQCSDGLCDDMTGAEKSRPRSRSRSRSRTPTRKTDSRTVTPRVKSNKSSAKKSAKKQTPKSQTKTPKASTSSAPKTPKSATKRKSEANDSSAVKKSKPSPREPTKTPGTRRSLRLAQSPRSETKHRNAGPRSVSFDANATRGSHSADNQSKGWLSYCSIM